MNRTVTVVIPTFERGHLARLCVESVLRQTRPAEEVLVVDNGSADGSAEALAAEFSGAIRVLREPRRGVAHARNLGVERARGDLLAFIDDDAQARPDWLARILACAAETGARGVGGPTLADWERPPSNEVRRRHFLGLSLGRTLSSHLRASAKALSYAGVFSLGERRRRLLGRRDFLIGTNCAFLRSVFEEGHRFRPPAWGGPDAFEDVEFSRRVAARHPVYYDPGVLVSHRIPSDKLTLRWLAAAAFSNGRQKAAFGGGLSPRGLSDAWGVDGWISFFSAAGYACGTLRTLVEEPWPR